MSRLMLPLSAIVGLAALAALACGGDTPRGSAVTPQPAAAQVAAGTRVTPTAAPAPAEAAAVKALPASSTNGTAPVAGDAVFAPEPAALTAVEVVKLLRPSVVHIASQVLAMGFFNQPLPQEGVGTGIVLDTEGHILTNNHVVQGAEKITVTLSTGESFTGQVVGTDQRTDLAVVRIKADGLQPAKLGKSADLQVGQDVIAIGHALGLPGGPTVSKGVVSALDRSIDTDPQTTIIGLIQTDAAINPGNSGGPLVNSRAEVVGMNTAIIQEARGIGFAISIDDAKTVASQLMATGSVRRGFLGIAPVNLTPELAAQIPLASTVKDGVLIARVGAGSPAAQGGLQEGDVIVGIASERIRNTGDMSRVLLAHPPGEVVNVVVFRGETHLETMVTLGERSP